MPTAGALSTRYGCRVLLVVSCLVACAALPLLATVSSAQLLAIVLFVFGAALGSADCVMNVQAVIVERASAKPLMSGFHAFYSLGGICGAASTSMLLTLGATPLNSTLAALAVMLLAVLVAYPGLLPYGNAAEGPAFAIPRGIVLFLGVLCFIVFLVEGSMLDWSAVLMTETRDTSPAQSGFAFASFSMAMTLGRLIGDTSGRQVRQASRSRCWRTACRCRHRLSHIGLNSRGLLARLRARRHWLLQHRAGTINCCGPAKDHAASGSGSGDYYSGLRGHSRRSRRNRLHRSAQQPSGRFPRGRRAHGRCGCR
jgi:hypothetical protein